MECRAPYCRCISPCADPPPPIGPLPVPDRNEVRALLQEAAEHGDAEMVAMCRDALNGSDDAMQQCALVLEEAYLRTASSLWGAT